MLGPTDGDGPCGRTFAILRETRMAAVVCEPVGEQDVEAMGALVAAVADVGAAITRGHPPRHRGAAGRPRRQLNEPELRPARYSVMIL